MMIVRSSLFAQMLGQISRWDFRAAVRRHRAEKRAKGFWCRDQFVAMLYAQMAGAHPLRDTCGGLASAAGKLAHLGVGTAPPRGPYPQWTFKRRGKTVTVNLAAAQAKAYQRAIDEQRKVEKLFAEMRALSRQFLEATTRGVKRRDPQG